ncbi:MAG: LL-diaminopimelate aminotransferase [Omnitrophica bacterium GWA2_52_12]|nr:MAG: LL-diaminopimelate aminotransferase [Omnitrophica bacterium GWA2_52_12]
MTQINPHYQKLQAGYLFPEIGRRVKEFSAQNPQAKIIRLGIGDVVLPLPESVRTAIKKATDELGDPQTFRGYGPEQGYDFLREVIAQNDFQARGAKVEADEIFVSDGSKCDCGNIQEIFSLDSKVAVVDPVYPVYVDTNVMAGRSGSYQDGRYANFVYMPATAENHFKPAFPKEKVDLIYLCSPANPTGTVLDKKDLEGWVAFAKKNEAIILFDAAYEAFITDDSLPRSIFEIAGAREVAIEFRSFSKTAGFTGTRCAFTAIPKDLYAKNEKGEKVSVHALWHRRHCTKFNGVSYPIQRGAEAVYGAQGKKEVAELIRYYMENARLILAGLQQTGLQAFGGVHAPYVWLKTPGGMKSWDFFDLLLGKAHVVGTPGAGFGPSGEGYFRLSAFGFRENILEALARIQQLNFSTAVSR